MRFKHDLDARHLLHAVRLDAITVLSHDNYRLLRRITRHYALHAYKHAKHTAINAL